jgi:DNA-binding transcriptional MerR regulator
MSILPELPEKRYFNIGEVAKLCLVKPSVLRFWEQEFPMLKASKRVANRRYYQVEDVEVARKIRALLYEEGFTIVGARQQLASLKKESKKVKPDEWHIINKTVKILESIKCSLDEIILKNKV